MLRNASLAVVSGKLVSSFNGSGHRLVPHREASRREVRKSEEEEELLEMGETIACCLDDAAKSQAAF